MGFTLPPTQQINVFNKNTLLNSLIHAPVSEERTNTIISRSYQPPHHSHTHRPIFLPFIYKKESTADASPQNMQLQPTSLQLCQICCHRGANSSLTAHCIISRRMSFVVLSKISSDRTCVITVKSIRGSVTAIA